MKFKKVSLVVLVLFLQSCSFISSYFPVLHKSKTQNTVAQNKESKVKEEQVRIFKESFRKAKKGEANGQYIVGICYESGYSVAQDLKQAIYWFRKAAEQGHGGALNKLGEYYEKGHGVSKDLNQAIYCYRKAAEQGLDAAAQYALGVCYKDGRGVTKDLKQAIYWFRKAAEQGHSGALKILGECYENGYGVSIDMNQALYWYRRASVTDAEALKKYEEILSESIQKKESKNTQTFIVNGVSFKMVYIQGGTFWMGTDDNDEYVYDQEKPCHKVTLSSFSIGQTEVTQRLWKAVMGNNPSFFKGPNRPVECVSWDDCMEFIRKLNKLTGKNFRLPTEAEWEFAATCGNCWDGWEDWNSGDETHNVGTKEPNNLGIYDMIIYDMIGNVFEWCYDRYSSYSYESQTNPRGGITSWDRVIRGGSWSTPSKRCRITYRSGLYPSETGRNIGLRLAM